VIYIFWKRKKEEQQKQDLVGTIQVDNVKLGTQVQTKKEVTPEVQPSEKVVKDEKVLANGYQPVFNINFETEVPKLPDIGKEITSFDFTYPIIEPFVKARIYYDSTLHELIYQIIEPELDHESRKILRLIESSIEELINISFIAIKDQKTVIEFLEKNVLLLLNEFRINVSKEIFVKMMYYVYRDFVGMNKIEPLMRDYFIEDIECNGIQSPIYIVHRKYRNLRSNIVYKTIPELSKFVEKLAQKAGKYISYANPILDGTMPDGSRINATYSQDISSKGPSMSIRKFTKEPWTPIHLMKFKTVAPEILAYIWLLVENGANIMVIGGTGSGKCVTGDTPIYLADNKIIPIKDLIESKFRTEKIKSHDGWEFVDNDGTEVLSMDIDNLKIHNAKISMFWRHKAPRELMLIKTRSGRSIKTTKEHPFFTFVDGKLIKIRADELSLDHKIAVPRNIPFVKNKFNLRIIDLIKNEKDLYVSKVNNEIKNICGSLITKFNLTGITQLARKYNLNPITLICWTKKNAIPVCYYNKFNDELGIQLKDDLLLKAKTSNINIKLPEFTPDLFRFIALIIGDGHLTKTNVQFNNQDLNLLNEFIYLGEKLFNTKSKIEYPKNRTTKVVIYSAAIAKILNIVFSIPYGQKSHSVEVPKMLFELDNEYISEFISGIVDTDGHIGRDNIEIGSESHKLIDQLSTLLLRLGIISYKSKKNTRVFISGINNWKLFNQNIKIRKTDKNQGINEFLSREIKTYISNVDLIPNVNTLISDLRSDLEITQKQLANNIGVSRKLISMWENGHRDPSRLSFTKLANYNYLGSYTKTVNQIAESDIYWDQISEIQILKNHGEEYVYDLTVDYHHNFLAGEIPIIAHNTSLLNTVAFFIPPSARVVSIEDTRELQLMHENWLPSVARQGIGFGENKQGEVTLFDLLKASFRQRPDQIIVGEIRGAEAFVLFQAAASGHAAMATMHANDVPTMVRRLETQPINLPPSLVQILDVACVMAQVKVQGKFVRRLVEVTEIVNVSEGIGGVETNSPFFWDPKTDRFYFKEESHAFEKLSVHRGLSKEELYREFQLRTKLFLAMYTNNIYDFKEVQSIIHEYFKDPKKILDRFGIV